METRAYFIHVLSALHAGTGQGVGVIDLPIAREKATNIPYVPGSSIKGVLRDRGRDLDLDKTARLFGPETDKADLHAGSIRITDARLLLLPVRSLLGTFAWVTSPYLLQRFMRDLAMASQDRSLEVPQIGGVEHCAVVDGEMPCVLTHPNGGEEKIYLEDLDLTARRDPQVTAWATQLGAWLFPAADKEWQRLLTERLCIVHDDVLGFLSETATEVVARIRLEAEKKSVEQGALWYEEALPTETVFYGQVGAQSIQVNGSKTTKDEVFTMLESLSALPLQFGGNATVGRGLCRFLLS